MHTCRCCGRELPSTPRTTLWVDDTIMALCNAAYEEAARRGSAEVEIGHLILCGVREQAFLAHLRATGLEPWRLEVAAERSLRDPSPRHAADGRTRTSDELRRLLERTEQAALRRGERFATVADLLEALAADSRGFAALLSGGSMDGTRDFPAAPSSDWGSDGQLNPSMHFSRAERLGSFGSGNPTRISTGDTSLQRSRERDERASWGGEREGEWRREGRNRQQAGRHDAVTEGLMRRLAEQERLLRELMDRLPARSTTATAEAGSEGTLRSPQSNSTAHATSQRLRARHQWFRRRARVRTLRGLRSLVPGATPTAEPSRGPGKPDPIPEKSERLNRGASPADAREPDLDRVDPEIEGDETGEAAEERGKRFYLAVDDDIVRAPSIGPKTAARLAACGLFRVGHLLAGDPQRISTALGVQWITPRRVADWQSQARLVCTVPWLRGTHAQLLVGAGYDTITKLKSADASAVCAAVLNFAGTRDGQSVLRSGPVPDMERIARWLGHVQVAEPERAA
jgi:hypothetical protein